MGKLISVHTTPAHLSWAVLPFLGMGLVILAAGILSLEPVAFLIGLFWFLFFFLNVGLPGHPAQRLEIYEEGLVHRKLWQTWTWKWTDFVGVNRSYTSNGSILYLQAADGMSVQFHSLGDWAKARQLILDQVEPIIYLKAMAHLRRGKTINITFALRIRESGLVHHGRFVAWRDVDYVEVDSRRVVIHSRQFKNWSQRVSLQTYRMQNGNIYATLVRDLWQKAHNSLRSVEQAHLVIDGVHFNSEGEMIEAAGIGDKG